MAKNLLDKRLFTNIVNANKKTTSEKSIKPPKTKRKKNLLSSRLTESVSVVELKNKTEQQDQEFIAPKLGDKTESNKEKVSDKVKALFKTKKKPAIKANERNKSVDNILDEEFDTKEIKEVKKYKTNHIGSIVKRIAISVSCIYVIMLIFGVVITDYTYDENGNAVAMAMSYSDLEALEEFELLIAQYYEMQNLYKQVLDIDYQVYLNPDNSTYLSAEYEGLLEDVSKLALKTESISISTAYNNIRSMMVSWIKTDIAVYLQNMSAAISQNNVEKADNAAQDRTRLQTNYEVITMNLVALGKKLKGMNVNDLVEWDPDKYNEQLSLDFQIENVEGE